MSDLVQVSVECWRGGKLLASYSMEYVVTLGAPATTPTESFISEAKTNLSNERLAQPPFDDIQFKLVHE
jgi:hypothetical protein